VNEPAGQQKTIELRDLVFRYPSAEGFSLEIPQLGIGAGDCVAVVGASGSGKTTLLGLMAGTLQPSTGAVVIEGTDLCSLDERQRRRFRVRRIGQVFQTFELLHYLTVLENVLLPHYIQGVGGKVGRTRERAHDLLDSVGLAAKAGSRPSELSQGEQQRVAVCRAMLNRPSLLLADEPTGNLDQANKQNVVDLLLEQARSNNSTLLMVTHDQSLLHSFPTVLDIHSLRCDPGPGPDA
jgi:putative ABC transport system ATP-binding protein